MAGALTISTLNDSSGVLATQNGMTGIAKAWVNFDGTGTVAIRDSFNVSSITDNGTGNYTVNFTTALPNSNYSVAGSSSTSSGTNPVILRPATFNTTTLAFETIQANGTNQDPAIVSVSVFSS
jgi:hypothetical protein